MKLSDLHASRRRFETFVSRYEGLFRRRSWRRFAGQYLAGLLGALERKSIEPIALEAGIPDRTLRHFIGQAGWDEEALLTEHQRHVVETLGDNQGVLVIDSTGFPKKGPHSVGVKRQWCGQLGKEENCQVATTLTYASIHGHAQPNRSLYLPEEWAKDYKRRRKCRVPEGVVFRRSWELGLEMVEEARRLNVPHSWVTGDEEFGQSGEFHDLLDRMGEQYIFEIRSNTHVWDQPRLWGKRRKRSSSFPTPPQTRWWRTCFWGRSLASRSSNAMSKESKRSDWGTTRPDPGRGGIITPPLRSWPIISWSASSGGWGKNHPRLPSSRSVRYSARSTAAAIHRCADS